MAAVTGQPGTKPSQLADPVPSGKASAVDDFFAEFDAPAAHIPMGSGDEQFAPAEFPEEVPEEQGIGGQILDGAGRALDYAGGAVRTGLAQVAGMAQDVAQGKNPLNEKPLVTEEDLANVAKGKAPSSAEYLRRLGVPEGGSLKVPGLGKVTARGAAGLASDVVTDPLTALTKITKEIPYLKTLFNAPGRGTEALGEAVYKSALPDAAKISKETKNAVGDALIEAGAPIGGTERLAQKVSDVSATIGKMRQGLYDKANQLGAIIDTKAKDAFKNSEAVLAKMRNNPTLRAAADELEEMLTLYKNEPFVTLDQMSAWKTALYDSLPANAFNGPKLKGQAKMFKSALAHDMKNIIVESGNKAEKGLGDAIDQLNSKWGTLLDIQDPLNKIASKSGGNLGKEIDKAILASGGVKAIITKKAMDLASSPAAKTTVGKVLMGVGRSGLADAAVRRGVVEASRPRQEEIPEE